VAGEVNDVRPHPTNAVAQFVKTAGVRKVQDDVAAQLRCRPLDGVFLALVVELWLVDGCGGH
jgi:hypothetical protein